ncbi:MAG TPA: PEP-CTERM sorting domain-containing protein [Candidatus Limnocylindria bacterium]|nr:PEP-CTERM sorting domain-containing protein [Candidatus Limnocylindria bacterium]
MKNLSLRHANVATASLVLGTASLHAQIQNPSFESPATPFVSVNIDNWQKAPKPGYFDEGSFGFQWVQTAGLFANTPPASTTDHIDNLDGNQSAYLLAFPGVTLYQDTSATFVPGTSYDMTIGLFGKNMADGNILTLTLYFRDHSNHAVPVGMTTLIYSAAEFPSTTHMTDFHVTVPTVLGSDPWANEPLGVEIQSVYGTGAGYWDVDNVRLDTTLAVPEPLSMGLSGVALAGFLAGRRFLQRRNA